MDQRKWAKYVIYNGVCSIKVLSKYSPVRAEERSKFNAWMDLIDQSKDYRLISAETTTTTTAALRL